MPNNEKTSRVLCFLKWLENHRSVRLIEGEKHLNVKHIITCK